MIWLALALGASPDERVLGGHDFGQPVAVSEVAALIHRTPGVVAVDVDSVHRFGTPPDPTRPVLRAALPKWSGADVSRAELLVLREGGVHLLEMNA